MKKQEISNKLIFGGLLDHNIEAEELRRLQIIEGMRIHTCNNYRESIELIKNASRGIEKNLKLLTKIYYKYPNIKHKRFRPLIYQLDEIVDRLGFIPVDWSLQLCCYCNLKELTKINASKFFAKIKQKYNINQIYLEYYPLYNYKLSQIDKLNNFYKSKISFGLIGYQNLCNRVFTKNDLKFLSSKSINIIFLGFLGKGIQNLYSLDSLSNALNKKNSIDANIFYLLSCQNTYKNIKGLTHVSSIDHYLELKKKLQQIDESLNKSDFSNYFIDEKKLSIYNFHDYDQYGGYITLGQYFKKPKLLMSKIKYIIKVYLKSFKFKNNFWG